MSIRNKLILSFGSLMALIILPNLMSLIGVKKGEKDFEKTTTLLEAVNVRVTRIMTSFVDLRLQTSKMGVYIMKQTDSVVTLPSSERFFEIDSTIKNDLDFISNISNELKIYGLKLNTHRNSFKATYQNLIDSAGKKDKYFYLNQSDYLSSIHDSINIISKQILTNLNEDLFEYQESGKKQSKNIEWILVAVVLLGMIITLLASHYILKSFLLPLELITDATKKIGKGDYSFRLNMIQKDEFGYLSRSFNQMLDDLNHAKLIETQKETLEKLNSELNVKNDSLDSFVYRVSHDLKAPIINISSLLGLVKKKMPANDDSLKVTFGYIDDSVRKLQTTIYDLLEVSRIERNLQAEKEDVYIPELITQVQEELRESFRKEKAMILTDYTEGGAYIHFAKANLKSILSNTISNAIKYRSPERDPVIIITTKMEGEYLHLKIEDNGIGIDLNRYKDKLYKMFSRFHSHVEGSGVGLYIIHKLIIDSGGKIDLQSTPLHGTTLHLYFKHVHKAVLV
jgi:signal transduction histidine kinase